MFRMCTMFALRINNYNLVSVVVVIGLSPDRFMYACMLTLCVCVYIYFSHATSQRAWHGTLWFCLYSFHILLNVMFIVCVCKYLRVCVWKRTTVAYSYLPHSVFKWKIQENSSHCNLLVICTRVDVVDVVAIDIVVAVIWCGSGNAGGDSYSV